MEILKVKLTEVGSLRDVNDIFGPQSFLPDEVVKICKLAN